MTEADDDTLGWAEFMKVCASEPTDRNRSTRRRSVFTNVVMPFVKNNNRTNSHASTPSASQAGRNDDQAGRNRIDTAARAALIKEGKYFKCFETGHLSRN